VNAAPACGVCGAPCRAPFRAPAAELAPDLDGRPGEPARSTLPRWVAACRNCGASAPDLTLLPKGAEAVVRSRSYHAEKNRFLRWAMICEAAGREADAAEALLQAAWAEDDAGRDATALRLRAAAIWRGNPLRRIDILRRAGALAQAEALAASLTGLDEESAGIVAFERDRIRAGDTGRHLISSALRPPARTPHVTHGTAPGRGLLGRLFGR
jgi:hypothetical protein